jgi:RNA polymerase-binding transcription factor DksA
MPVVEGASPVEGSLEDVTLEQVTPEDVARLESELDMIDEALVALQEGSYGYCKGCGEPIEDEVLSVDPLAKRCGGCASSQGLPDHDSHQNNYSEEVFFSGAEI